MKPFRIVWAVLFALLISLGGSAPTLISLRQLATSGTPGSGTFLRGDGAWTAAAQLGSSSVQTFQGQITGPLFVSGNLQLFTGSSTYQSGLVAENYGGGMLLDFGANYSQLGGNDNSMFGSYFRIDTRDALASEMFSITAIPSGTGTGTSREQKIFKVDRTGNIFSTTNAYQVLTTNSVLSGAKVVDPVGTLTANYTATSSDSVLLGNAASAAITVTLPSAAAMTGETLLVKKIDATTNAVTLATTSSQTIDGAASYALNTQHAAISVVSDGANWRITMVGTAGSRLDIYGGPSSSGAFTWTKPSWAKTVRVVVLGAGAGGGSGRRGAVASARTGGAGGGGGSINESTFPASLLPATVSINIQAGGAGGAAVTTDSTSGNAGASISGLTPTSFGTVPLAVRVYGALSGGAGTTAAATGGQGTNNMFSRPVAQ